MSAVIDGISVEGHFSERFSATASQFAKNFSSGADLGASFAMSVDGEMVVDIWAGHKDEARREPWEEDTIVNVWSSTKTVSFLCALVLADRGLLNFDAPVARYWPEFAENGKNDVLVWHIMSHAAGLSGMSEAVTAADFYNWEKMTRLLAAQAPWWPPGTASGSHALTQGYLIGEVVRRITGKTMGQFLQEEIAGPLQADDLNGQTVREVPRRGSQLGPPGKNDNTTGVPDTRPARTE
ncbi:MAG: serine hydrolase domain-containing protein, partial [Gammaproteobacteria bacterium]